MGDSERSTEDWYERRRELRPGQVFRMYDDSIVRLDRSVPGDGTSWYVEDWCQGWSMQDSRIEPGELVERMPDDYVPPSPEDDVAPRPAGM
jgi:hypothetical protein